MITQSDLWSFDFSGVFYGVFYNNPRNGIILTNLYDVSLTIALLFPRRSSVQFEKDKKEEIDRGTKGRPRGSIPWLNRGEDVSKDQRGKGWSSFCG